MFLKDKKQEKINFKKEYHKGKLLGVDVLEVGFGVEDENVLAC